MTDNDPTDAVYREFDVVEPPYGRLGPAASQEPFSPTEAETADIIERMAVFQRYFGFDALEAAFKRATRRPKGRRKSDEVAGEHAELLAEFREAEAAGPHVNVHSFVVAKDPYSEDIEADEQKLRRIVNADNSLKAWEAERPELTLETTFDEFEAWWARKPKGA